MKSLLLLSFLVMGLTAKASLIGKTNNETLDAIAKAATKAELECSYTHSLFGETKTLENVPSSLLELESTFAEKKGNAKVNIGLSALYITYASNFDQHVGVLVFTDPDFNVVKSMQLTFDEPVIPEGETDPVGLRQVARIDCE